MRKFKCFKSVFVAACLMAGLAANAGPFTNGSFEIPVVSGSGAILNPGDTWLTGWTVGGPGGGDVEAVNGPGINGMPLGPTNGQQWIIFNSGNTAPGGVLSQTFDTAVGQAYTVSFAVGRAGAGNISITATALAAGGALLASNYCVPPTSGVWTMFQLVFTATTPSTTLVFTDTSTVTVAVDIGLDAVTVTTNQMATVPSFVNGSFESPVESAGAVPVDPGETWLTGWSAGGPNGVIIGLAHGAEAGFNAYDGQQWIYFGGIPAPVGGWVAQTFSTTIGQNYAVTYYVGQNGTGDFSLTGTVLDASSNLLASNRCVSVSGTWIQRQLAFTAATTDTTVVFTDSSPADVDGGDVTLDDVSAVLLPSTGIPIVLESPASQSVNSGSNVTFSARASGSPSTLQWYFNSNQVTGATGNVSPLNVTADDTTAGSYWAVFSNSFGAATTAVAVLTVLHPPIIATSPVSQTAASGVAVPFTAAATGGPVTMQWYLINYLGTNAVAGGTNTTLIVTACGPTVGSYFAVFSNAQGTAATSVANLAVTGLAFVNGSFENPLESSGTVLPVNPGDNWLTGWSVGGPGGVIIGFRNGSAGSFGPFDGQQWIYFGGIPAPTGGWLAQTFTTVVGCPYVVTYYVGESGVGTFGLSGAAYDAVGNVLTSNRCVPVSATWTQCQLSFTAATTNTTLVFKDTSTADINGGDPGLDAITVTPVPTAGIPVIVTSPASQTVNSGSNVTFSASAAGSPSTLQWYFNSNQVTGAAGTVSPLTVTANDTTAGNYVAVFSNSFGMATTIVAVLTVIDPPVITVSPVSQVVTAGTQVTFTAAASGSPSSVQWYLINHFGSNAISGATSTNLTFMAVGASAGNYLAIFSNGAGTATTSEAALAVNAGPFANGGFELINNHAALPANYATTIPVGSTWLNNWSIGGSANHTAVIKGSYLGFSPYEGQQYMAFAAGGGFVSQTFSTVPGAHCALSLAAGKYGTWGTVSVTAAAYADDGTLLSSNRFSPATGVWTSYPFDFTSTTTNTTLVLTDTSTGTYTTDLVLDDVTLVSAPVIVTSPLSQTNQIGTTVTLTASASGSPATVQWFQGTNSLLNATNTTLSFTVNSGSGGNYTAVFSNSAGSATTAPAVLTVDIPAWLTQQPQSIVTNVGATVTLAGAGGGTAPLSYQWQFDGTNISGATNAGLVLTNAQPTNAGSYTLVVANGYGTNVSTNAVLTFISTVQVGSGTVAVTIPVTMAGVSNSVNMAGVILPINLLATGDENGLGFTLNYDPSMLTYVGATPGTGLPNGTTFGANATQSGSIGLAVILPGGMMFAAGTQQIVQVTFQLALVTKAVPTAIGFGDVPAPRGISDTNGIAIPGAYLGGTVTVMPTPLEGDVAPVGNENFVVGITDWVQEGRYVAEVDTITDPSEFQRADCAPRDTLGDGYITVADWVQLGRYYLGLDPPTPQGGPTGPPTGSVAALPAGKIKPQNGLARTISISPLTQGATAVSAVVQLAAQGDESGLQFSVNFDPAALSFAGASLGGGATGATLQTNTKNLANGQLGIALAMMGKTFAAGTQDAVKLYFNSTSYSNTTTLSTITTLSFGDSPLICQVADSNADVVSASYQSGALQVAGLSWPQLGISHSGGGITLSWPAAPTALAAQWTTNLGANWTNTGGTPVTNGGTVYLTLPAPASTTFYRLAQP
jgi:hypothetical protein